jgi:hypothetical protein
MRIIGDTTFVLLLVLPGLGEAKAGIIEDRYFASDSCYARSYAPSHLHKRPLQTVTHVYIVREPMKSSNLQPVDQFTVRFGFETKKSKETFQSLAECRSAGPTAMCQVEGDGGNFALASDGWRLRIIVGDRIEVEGLKGTSPDLALGDNKVMLLAPSDPGACQ